MKGKGGGAAAAATVAKAPAPTKRAGGRRRGGPSRASAAVRIQRELMDFQQNSPPSLSVNVRADNMNVWVVTLNGVEGTLFEGEKHKLRIEFPREYPAKPPSVYFLKPTPRHPHVYTNGDICLDLLGKGWKPQITTRTLAISILSMLSSAKEKGIPPDNSNHADNAPGRPQEGEYQMAMATRVLSVMHPCCALPSRTPVLPYSRTPVLPCSRAPVLPPRLAVSRRPLLS